MTRFIDLTGQRFGRLVVLELAPRSPNETIAWLCQCDCGRTKVAKRLDLRSGDTSSCGCFELQSKRQTPFKHGHTVNGHTAEYRVWYAMRQRCSNSNHAGYGDYGGRGIKVCERWLTFERFLEDMGPKPSPRHSLDRHPDNNGNYEPGNVRWATRKEQMRKTRRTLVVNYNGVEMSLAEFTEKAGLSYKTMLRRVHLNLPLPGAVLLTKPKYLAKDAKSQSQAQEPHP